MSAINNRIGPRSAIPKLRLALEPAFMWRSRRILQRFDAIENQQRSPFPDELG